MEKSDMNLIRKVVLVMATVLLAGCGSTVEIGLSETVQPDKWQATYETFTGTKTQGVLGSVGQTLAVTYNVVVDRGSLEIKIQDATTHVLEDVTIYESAQGTLQFQVFQTGQYDIIVVGAETGGSFDLSWQLTGG
jgi:hypothetical protein